MGQFINPFTDVGFKRIFGQEISKPLLIDFLNNLLEGERKIVELTFLDKEQLPEHSEDRALIYDIYCEIEGGEHIIVEMQNQRQSYFKDRSIYYCSKAIVQQGVRGSYWNYEVKAVYLVAFLNFSLHDISDEFRTDVALMDMRSKTLFSDKLRLIYLQLPFFEKEADECKNDFERWIYLLKNMETLKRMPYEFKGAVFQKLANIADFSALDKHERDLYDESLRRFRDTIAVMEYQRNEGRAEGRAEGLKDATTDLARRMKAMGMDVNSIAEITRLSAEEIASL